MAVSIDLEKAMQVFMELPLKRQLHCITQSKMALVLAEHTEELKHLKQELFFLGLLHDIGYVESIAKTGFHPVDGYRFLESVGFSDTICCAVLNHSAATELADEKNNKVITNTKPKNAQEFKVYLEVIDLLDSHTDGDGKCVSMETRYRDILSRYGKTALPTIVFANSMERVHELEEKYNFNELMHI